MLPLVYGTVAIGSTKLTNHNSLTRSLFYTSSATLAYVYG